ncbi:unnamed protein product [[Candida] boidinii]|nr:unnamed protein product [[Candida] boidinii]
MGVLLHTLVFKENPFSNVDEIMDGDVHFPQFSTPPVSDECKDLIKSMLILDVNKRPTMEDVLKHDWLKGFS